jgi:O-antigen/teichoic acid export membrane protein
MTGVGRHLGRAGQAMADQVLSSGTQLLLIVLIARMVDPTTFGAVSVALLVHGFLLGVVRAAIAEVVLLRCRARLSESRREARVGSYLTLSAGGIAGVGLLCVGLAVGGEVGHYLQLVALAAPAVYTQDLLRYVAYGTGQIGLAITIDGIWIGVQVLLSIVLIGAGEATPSLLVVAWIAGAVAGAAAGALLLRLCPRPVALGRWWVEERARSGGFVTDFLVANGLMQGSFILLSVLLPLDEFGGLRAAFLCLSPLANLLASVRTLTLAHLAGLRGHPARARWRAIQAALALGATGALYAIGLIFLPDRWGSELFGQTWDEAIGLVGILAVAEMVRLGSFAAIDLVKALGSPMDLVRTRAVSSAGAVTGLLVGAIAAGPRGAVVGTVAGNLLITTVWWRRAWIVSDRPPPRVASATT